MNYFISLLHKISHDIEGSPFKEFLYFILFPFLIWFCSFLPVFLGQKSLYLDSTSYFYQTSFFVDHLKQGFYPLWLSQSEWGMTYEFFLRRIGDGNPMYLFLVLLSFLGLSYQLIYFIFLIVYFFLGVYAFYGIAKLLFEDRFFAFLAYIVFLFSSFSAHLFSNYILLLFVPLMGFFYFFLSFIKNFRPWQFLGLILCMAIGLTTYVPSIFALILLWLSLCLGLFYFQEIPVFLRSGLDFIQKNKIVFWGSLLFLFIALLPVGQFYMDSKNKEIFLPSRSAGEMLDRSGQVADISVNAGDVFAHGHFEKLFFNQTGMTRWEFFISYVVFLLLLMSFFAPINRLFVFLGVLGLGIFLVSAGHLTPLFQWLYQYVFGVKYIRQLFYFFWVFVLPVAILWIVASLKALLEETPKGMKKIGLWVWYALSSLAFLIFIFTRTGILWGGLLSSVMAVVWLGVLLFDEQKKYRFFLLILALLFVGWQGFELNQKMVQTFPDGALQAKGVSYEVSENYFIRYPVQITQEEQDEINPLLLTLSGKTHLHVASFWLIQLRKNPDVRAFQWFTRYRFWLYDQVVAYDDDMSMISDITSYWREGANKLAFVPRSMAKISDIQALKKDALAVPVTLETSNFQITKITPNRVVLKTSFSEDKFLLMTDTYSHNWRALMDQKPLDILRANIAFKGFWIPKGEHQVIIFYASIWQELGRFFVLFCFAFVLGACVFCFVKDGFQRKRKA